jgi:hypothetical protein
VVVVADADLADAAAVAVLAVVAVVEEAPLLWSFNSRWWSRLVVGQAVVDPPAITEVGAAGPPADVDRAAVDPAVIAQAAIAAAAAGPPVVADPAAVDPAATGQAAIAAAAVVDPADVDPAGIMVAAVDRAAVELWLSARLLPTPTASVTGSLTMPVRATVISGQRAKQLTGVYCTPTTYCYINMLYKNIKIS